MNNQLFPPFSLSSQPCSHSSLFLHRYQWLLHFSIAITATTAIAIAFSPQFPRCQILEEKDEVEEDETSKKKSSSHSSPKEAAAASLKVERPARERKAIGRYSIASPASRSSCGKPLEIAKGSGTFLKDIPSVAYKLSKRKPNDKLQFLHLLINGVISGHHHHPRVLLTSTYVLLSPMNTRISTSKKLSFEEARIRCGDLDMLKKLGILMNENHYSCSVLHQCKPSLKKGANAKKGRPAKE